jgi:hypothetical protein
MVGKMDKSRSKRQIDYTHNTEKACPFIPAYGHALINKKIYSIGGISFGISAYLTLQYIYLAYRVKFGYRVRHRLSGQKILFHPDFLGHPLLTGIFFSTTKEAKGHEVKSPRTILCASLLLFTERIFLLETVKSFFKQLHLKICIPTGKTTNFPN